MPYVTTLLLAVPTAAAQSLRVAESPEELDRRARADSNDPAAHYNAALGWWSRNRYDRADSALERALALDPSLAAAWLARGLVQDRNEDYWRWIQRGGESAVALERRRREAFFRRAFLVDPFVDVRLLGSVTLTDARFSAMGLGFDHLIEGRYDQAFDRFEEVLRGESRQSLDSVPPVVLWFHQLAAARSNHLADALADAQALLRLSLAREEDAAKYAMPLAANEFRYLVAALLQRMGRADEAIRMYQEVLEHDISNFIAHVQLARLYESRGDTAAALIERQRASEANPDDHAVLLDLGNALVRSRRWEDADEVLSRAATLGPRDARIFYLQGFVRMQLGRNAGARASFERFLALAPSRVAPAIADARRRLASLGN